MRADVLAREELRIRSQSETNEHNLARENVQAEIKAKNKQFKIQASDELQQQKLEMEMKLQIAQMELMERRELEFQQEKLREKDTTAKEMEARLLLETQLAEEKCKTLRLEYEAKFRRHELAVSEVNPDSRARIILRHRAKGTHTYRCTSTVHLQCSYTEFGTLL